MNALLSYDNAATIKTSGMDIAWNWFKPIGEANLGFSLQATILDYYKTKQSPAPFDVETDWAGSLGPNLSGTNAGAYDYRLFGSVNYSRNDWNVALRWRHLPSVFTAQYATQQAIKKNNASVAAGGAGILLGYTPTTEYESNDYNLFDLSFGWDINDTLSFRGGITNLFDTDPEFVGREHGISNRHQSGGCLSEPRRRYLAAGLPSPARLQSDRHGGRRAGRWTPYNAGYYDTLGRRFFVGLSMQF